MYANDTKECCDLKLSCEDIITDCCVVSFKNYHIIKSPLNDESVDLESCSYDSLNILYSELKNRVKRFKMTYC